MPHYTFQSSRVRRNVMGMRLLICPLLYPPSRRNVRRGRLLIYPLLYPTSGSTFPQVSFRLLLIVRIFAVNKKGRDGSPPFLFRRYLLLQKLFATRSCPIQPNRSQEVLRCLVREQAQVQAQVRQMRMWLLNNKSLFHFLPSRRRNTPLNF